MLAGIKKLNNTTLTKERKITMYQVPSMHTDGKSMYYNGNYCGVDRVYNASIDKFVKPTFESILSSAAMYGLSGILINGTKQLMTFECPRCGKKRSMIKLHKKPDHRNRIHACKDCGYRHMTPGYKKTHGTFLTGTLVV